MGKLVDWAKSNSVQAVSLGLILVMATVFVAFAITNWNATASTPGTDEVVTVKTDAEIEREMKEAIRQATLSARDKTLEWAKSLHDEKTRRLWTVEGFEFGERHILEGKLERSCTVTLHLCVPQDLSKKIRVEVTVMTLENLQEAEKLLKSGEEFSLSFEHTALEKLTFESNLWIPVYRGWFLFVKVDHKVLAPSGTPPSGATSTAGPVGGK